MSHAACLRWGKVPRFTVLLRQLTRKWEHFVNSTSSFSAEEKLKKTKKHEIKIAHQNPTIYILYKEKLTKKKV